MSTAKLPFAVVLCGLAACSVYEDTLGNGAPDGGAGGSSQVTSAGAGDVTTSTATTGGAGGTATVGTGGEAGTFATGGSTGSSGSLATGGVAGSGSTGSGEAGAGGSAGNAAAGSAGGSGSSGGSASAGGAPSTGGSAGSSSAGSGGAGGTSSGPVDAGSDAGPVGICNYANPITLLYRYWPTEAGASLVDFSFKLVNGSTQVIQLSTIIARYYFMNELSSPMTLLAYGDVCCPDKVITTHVSATLHSMAPPAASADTYIEFAFDASAGTLAPAHTVEVEVELANAVGSMSNQSNDYSYIATATGTQALWDNCPSTGNCAPFHSCVMTVFQGGALIWGTPPQ